jgi:hypothetical protein
VRIPYTALRQELVLEKAEGQGAYGATFADPVLLRASVQHTQQLVTDWKNETITINTLVIVRPEAGPVPPGSKVTIADAAVVQGEDDVYRVVKSFPIPDGHSPSHWELMCALWGSA